MRKTLLLVLILLVSAGMAVAQQSTTSPSTSPASPSSQASPSDQSMSPGSQATSPSSQAASPSAGETSVEGCLGGSAGNFTVMDQSGTTFQLQLPASADSSSLAQHVGQQVRVTGTVAGAATPSASSSASTAGATASATGSNSQSSIKVSKIDKISDSAAPVQPARKRAASNLDSSRAQPLQKSAGLFFLLAETRIPSRLRLDLPR